MLFAYKSTLNYEFTMYVSYVLLCVVDAIYVDEAILINTCKTMYDLYRKALNSEVITR